MIHHPRIKIRAGLHNTGLDYTDFESFKTDNPGPVKIGDCNRFEPGVRILVPEAGVTIGDWNVFHRNILMMGEIHIGHNCWVGQNALLDGAGILYIRNGVRIGMNSHIWTHVASGELIEGSLLFDQDSTYLQNDVWLVGGFHIIAPGVTMAPKSLCLSGSVLTKNTGPKEVWAGVPAKLTSIQAWTEVEIGDKMEMMLAWASQFVDEQNLDFHYKRNEKNGRIEELILSDPHQRDNISINYYMPGDELHTTYFVLVDKTYTKRLSVLERRFIRFLSDHKARFVPRGYDG